MVKIKNRLNWIKNNVWNWVRDKSVFFKRIPILLKIAFLILLIVLIIYWCITSNFDFVSIQDVESEDINRSKSIQIIETLKLVLLITTPILTMILFLNTINVQKLNNRNLGKDSMSRDFYNLLTLFKQEQEKSKDSLEDLGRSAKFKLENVVFRLDEIEKKKNIEEYENYINTLKTFVDEEYNSIKFEYESLYFKIGTYFRILHRLIKVINDRFENGIINEDERMMYIGILRAQLSLDELLAVLVNSLEIKKGIGLGVELMGSSFFGDSIDIDDGQHFECPDEYRDNLKKYFVHSINSDKDRKIFRDNFTAYRGNEDITNFQSLIDKIDSQKN